MNEYDFEIIMAMRTYGGGFVKELAHAAAYADEINLKKIKDTWPEYWEEYRLVANAHAYAQTNTQPNNT